MAAELKPYPGYKDSGVEWLGKVPTHWEVRRLKNWLGVNERVLPEDTDPQYTFEYVDIGSVETGRLAVRPERIRFGDSPSRARRVVRSGDTIVSTVRTYLKAVWHAERPGAELIASTGFAVLTPRRGTLPRFVSYLCQSEPLTDRVTAESVGIAYPAIAETRLGTFEVCVPPLAEQAAIVRFLDHAYRRIRRYIRAKEKLIALLEEQRQTILHRIVTGRIDVRNSQSFRTYRPSGLEWPGEVPAHWEVVPFKRRVGFQEGPGIMAADFRESGVPLLRISCLRGEVATLSNCNYLDPDMVRKRWGHFAVRQGDYLLSASASTGAVSLATGEVVGAIPYTGIIRLWARSERTVMEYVRLFLDSRLFQDQTYLAKSGVGIEHFGPTHLSRMVIVLPSVPEQDALVRFFREAIAPLASRIAVAHREIELLREYRTRLFADVPTGKLDVREAAAALAQVDGLGADRDADATSAARINADLENVDFVPDKGEG